MQMYKSTYLAVRVHTEDEALRIEPSGNTDTMLWLIDVYDLGQSAKCAEAVKRLILRDYHALHERVPGMLPRWTKGMMAWVTYLNALVPCYDYDEQWVVRNHFMIQKNPENWSVETMLTALDALAIRWTKAHALDRDKLQQYLHCVWSCAKKWTMHLHEKVEPGLHEGDMMKVHPRVVLACLSRFFWFNKTLDLHAAYPRETIKVKYNNFFERELRHFVLRKFRDQLLNTLWDHLSHPGDLEIASHDQLGDNISTYSALYKRQPVCLLQKAQKSMLFDEPEEVRRKYPNPTDIKIVQTYFQNTFKMDFAKFFVCFERNHCKHERAVRESAVPIIVESFRKYSVVHNGKAYGFGSFADAFAIWLKFANKPYRLDLTELREKMFGESTASAQSTIYELDV
tara:strand:- start:5202 stop:6395 length:1194 start_codon:yes stop_codon:yes gene_type:complete